MANKKARGRLRKNGDAERVVRLFRDTASLGQGALDEKAAQALGIQTLDDLKRIITDPVYRGTNRVGTEEHPWEEYRIVEDAVWWAANRALPRRRARTEPEGIEAATESLISRLGLVRFLSHLVESGRLPCQECGEPLGWNGYSVIRNTTVPQLVCSKGHTEKWTDYDSIEAGLTRRSCFGCNNDDQRNFHQWKAGTSWYARCNQCGWNTGRLAVPAFAPLKPAAASATLYGLATTVNWARSERVLSEFSA